MCDALGLGGCRGLLSGSWVSGCGARVSAGVSSVSVRGAPGVRGRDLLLFLRRRLTPAETDRRALQTRTATESYSGLGRDGGRSFDAGQAQVVNEFPAVGSGKNVHQPWILALHTQ